jgi:hypothetical protein
LRIKSELFRNRWLTFSGAFFGAVVFTMTSGCPAVTLQVSAAEGVAAAVSSAAQTASGAAAETAVQAVSGTAAESTAQAVSGAAAEAVSQVVSSAGETASQVISDAAQTAAEGAASSVASSAKAAAQTAESAASEADEETTAGAVDMEVILNDPELFQQYCEQLTLQVEELQRQQEEAKKAAEAAREELSNQTKSKTWKGAVLNKVKGIVKGPNGKETYYNLNMSKIVAVLHKAGYEGDYWVRKDGVKMFGDYIMVAANYSRYHYGTIVETSLGTGIVCDTGDFAKSSRVSLDIATAW